MDSQDTENTANNTKVAAGDRAPDFALPNAGGEIVRLSDFAGKRNVVLDF